jgi:hypothetical protein
LHGKTLQSSFLEVSLCDVMRCADVCMCVYIYICIYIYIYIYIYIFKHNRGLLNSILQASLGDVCMYMYVHSCMQMSFDTSTSGGHARAEQAAHEFEQTEHKATM